MCWKKDVLGSSSCLLIHLGILFNKYMPTVCTVDEIM